MKIPKVRATLKTIRTADVMHPPLDHEDAIKVTNSAF